MGADLLEQVEVIRSDAGRRLRASRRPEWGQFLTPAPVARLLASLLEADGPVVRLLDPGAGVGSLSAAAVAELCRRDRRPDRIHVTAFEIDPVLVPHLSNTLALCRTACQAAGVGFSADIVAGDFLAVMADRLTAGLFGSDSEPFTCVVLNPPYKKIARQSEARRHLHRIGVETSNLYTGFLAAASRALAPAGELVAITPRSFCNGSYFRRFRQAFLAEMRLQTVHVFESRQDAFRDDEVLQESVVVRAVRSAVGGRGLVTVRAGVDANDPLPLTRQVPYDAIVRPTDPQSFIRIAADDLGDRFARRATALPATLADLGLAVSTGRVVDFRARPYLRTEPGPDTAPLVWPAHFDDGYIAWPKPGSRKPEAIVVADPVRRQLVPNEPYVVVRRFSAKEERRRVVAAVHDPARVPGELVGFENHLNYFHRNGRGLDPALARGLAVFLNSTLVDAYFRQFSGHTQVNATDLRSLRYPTAAVLRRWGDGWVRFPTQDEIDALLAEETHMSDAPGLDPVRAKEKADQALAILRALGLPRPQLNERSALTLLALLGLLPDIPWAAADNPLCGITPMMAFFRDHYGKRYAPNTRETVRRETVHQFLEAGLIVPNPDRPERPVNSPKAVYQIEASALALLRAFGSDDWDAALAAYLASVGTLKARYARERTLARIPVTVAPGREITLSPGGQNVLVKLVLDEFVPRFATPGRLLYVGDTDEKFAHFDRPALAAVGVRVDEHGKMPDVVVYHTQKDWLVLIEAVVSHGPVDGKRHDELKRLFAGATCGLVFVTAFLNRKAMVKYLGKIAWETEVWVADSPTHLIHFDGLRFLGPYTG